MSQRIYCISGLGANEKVFSRLQLPGYELVFLQWMKPEQNESIGSYAQRMATLITDQRPVLLGVSFGGMVAVEISKVIEVEKLVLVSSVTTRHNLPWWMRTAGALRLHRLIRPRPHPWLYPIENYFLGAAAKSEKKIANQFRQTVNDYFLQWSINEIVTWSNVTKPHKCIQIHGAADKLFPVRKSNASYHIEKGGHFMVYNRAAEVSNIILQELRQRTQ
jgi:pimeloyl-ACP methyl ester carboxylesterase